METPTTQAQITVRCAGCYAEIEPHACRPGWEMGFLVRLFKKGWTLTHRGHFSVWRCPVCSYRARHGQAEPPTFQAARRV